MITLVMLEDVCCRIRNVKFYNILFYNKSCLLIMFVTAVCFLFLLKLKCPKNKHIYDYLIYVLRIPIKAIIKSNKN